MASSYIYKDGNVTFTNIKQPGLPTGQKISGGKYVIENDEIQIPSVVINAIDIDWNSATINGISFQTINTSADLLNLIKQIHDRIPKSIYDLEGGFNVLTRDNLEAVKGELQGKSAYDIAKEIALSKGQQFNMTEEQWIDSLKGERGLTGENGRNGATAFEIARAYYQTINKDFPYSNEYEWMEAIVGGGDIDEKLNRKQDILSPGEGITIVGSSIYSPLATWINVSGV